MTLPPPQSRPTVVDDTLDPAAHPWLADHRPNGVVAVVPGTTIADRLAVAGAESAGRPVRGLRDVRFRRWLRADISVRLRTEVMGPPDEPTATLSAWHESATEGLSRFTEVATGQVLLGDPSPARPARFASLDDTEPRPAPYTTGEMFHGPSLRYLVSAQVGSAGYTAVLDADRGRVPAGLLHHGLLDAAMHGVTSRALRQWSPHLGDAAFGFPLRLDSLRVFAPVPVNGLVDAEVRFVGFAPEGEHDQPVIDVQLCQGSLVLVDFRVTLVLRPVGRFSHVGTGTARAFIEDGVYVAEMLLTTTDGEVTRLRRSDLDALDFLPGTVARIYGLRPDQNALVAVAAKEHVSRRLGVHPRLIEVDADLSAARCAQRPDQAFPLCIDRTATEVAVTSNDTAQRSP